MNASCSNDAGSSSSSHLRRPAVIMSHIPVPQQIVCKLPSSTSTIATTSALPQRVQVSNGRRPAAGNNKMTGIRSSKTTSSLTIPRAPMRSLTNSSASAEVSVVETSSSKNTTSEAIARKMNRRRISGGRGGGGGARMGKLKSSPKRNAEEEEASANESRVMSMQDLFELERRMTEKTETIILREKAERQIQEDKVRQLEQDLMEHRRAARQAELEGPASWKNEDEYRQMKQRIIQLQEEVEQGQSTIIALKMSLSQQSTSQLTLEAANSALRIQLNNKDDTISQLEFQNLQLKEAHLSLLAEKTELEDNLRFAETLRRKLHNEVQELRGNIRVFVRVRPSISNDVANGTTTMATIRYPNERESTQIELLASGESATGTAIMKNHQFNFDRVFSPKATQTQVFEEVAHLTQSVLDGYNTCIFAYGQTGSGKTHTLEGPVDVNLNAGADPLSDLQSGIIPRAVQMLWKTAEDLVEQGWRYSFEGQILEIYNEGIQDLLGKHDPDAKYEVKHEKGRTIVTDATIVPLVSPSQVFTLLARAKSRRQTASTLMNERSSRSHSIFTVRVQGNNPTTMESCDAVLNLVDLAGSERLNNSGSGSNALRLKEAQCINKSLSSLADVIGALQQAKHQSNAHIPYRNSILTWLLKNSLGGNAKTLMLLTLSPMAEHMNESLCSLRFASKVNSTFIGTARRVGGITS